MSLVCMPSPLSWFRSLSALTAVLLKQVSSKGNFWQKNRACILCSSALRYLGASRRESPPLAARGAYSCGVCVAFAAAALAALPCPLLEPLRRGARTSFAAVQPWCRLLPVALPSNTVLDSCRQCLPSAGFLDAEKESLKAVGEKKEKRVVLVSFILRLARVYRFTTT